MGTRKKAMGTRNTCSVPDCCVWVWDSLSVPALTVGALLGAYPPHGGIRLLEPQHTDGGRPAIDRFVAEDYIIDTLAAFDADRCGALALLPAAAAPVLHVYGRM
eukprot:943610-Pelagomonas_calceolata.AAC.7